MLNLGLLGNLKEFKTFAKNLHHDPAGYGRLRQVIRPYILRRLKTDTSIINDLPDKVEMKTFASLSKKQIILYRDLLDDLKDFLEHSEGIQRRGLILSSLMQCKQLCNHPDQFLGTGGFEEQHSGKFQRLRELCKTLLEKREKMLVFTQFREITAPLHDFLTSIFGRDGVVLYGSVPVKQRQARAASALDFHCNASLATLNVVRAEALRVQQGQEPQVFSMASWKQCQCNERLLDLFMEKFALDPTWVKNHACYDELRTYGTIAA